MSDVVRSRQSHEWSPSKRPDDLPVAADLQVLGAQGPSVALVRRGAAAPRMAALTPVRYHRFGTTMPELR